MESVLSQTRDYPKTSRCLFTKPSLSVENKPTNVRDQSCIKGAFDSQVFEASPMLSNQSKDRLSSSSSSSMVSVIAAPTLSTTSMSHKMSNKSSSTSTSTMTVTTNVDAASSKASNKSAINPNYSVIKPISRSASGSGVLESKKTGSYSSDCDEAKQFEDYFAKMTQVINKSLPKVPTGILGGWHSTKVSFSLHAHPALVCITALEFFSEKILMLLY